MFSYILPDYLPENNLFIQLLFSQSGHYFHFFMLLGQKRILLSFSFEIAIKIERLSMSFTFHNYLWL